MIVSSTGIVDGHIQDRFGQKGTQFNEAGVPSYSLPLKIEQAPKGTVSFAFVLEDKDAYPVVGFSWIHWMGADLTRTELRENESLHATDFVQGANSWISLQGGSLAKDVCSGYGGMTPPDAPHRYELHVYALDAFLELPQGFLFNELHRRMEGHILDQATLKGIYNHGLGK